MLNYKKIQTKLLPSLSALALLNTSIYTGVLNGQDTVEEIVVTARKKSESLQDVPLSVSALRESDLEEKGVNVFEDYLLQLPGVTAGGSGPGQSTIYIRGLASTTPNLTTAGVAGLAPNVSFYLDEQPLAQPGRNLDVYAADMARIEVLSGPQGTLFGASSQAGVVRMITNKPVMGESLSSIEVESRFTSGGDEGSKLEYMTNVPLGERSALRFVAYRDRRGGYIDQVAGTLNASQSARFRAAGTVRANGLPVSSSRGGFQAGADLSGVTLTNAVAIEKENANPVTYEGFRASVAHEINDNWNALATVAKQTIDADGVFFVDPTLDDLEIQRYTDDTIEDEFENMSLTLEGSVGDLEVVYAGAYTDRVTDQNIDYTDYLFVGQYLPYYICDYYVTYTSNAPGNVPTGTCGAPNLLVDSTTNTEVQTHEIRISGAINDTMSFTAGAFMSDLELTELNLFNYPGSVGNDITYAANYALTDTSVTGSINNASPGWFSAGPYSEPVIFFNDIKRTDNQQGFFGEISMDVSETSELTVGARWYDIEVDFEGSANSSFYNGFGAPDTQQFGSNLSAQYAPGNANGYPDKAKSDGVIGKVTYSWNPSEDLMYYVTWSEGFRPGLLNRPVGSSNADGSYVVKPEVKSDEVTNLEFGWKTVLRDGKLRFNGSAFMVDVSGLQSTIFDPSIVNLFFSDNAADADITGLEGDFVYYTNVNGLVVSGAFSMLDTEITKSLVPTSDVVVGSDLAFAPGSQANLAARKEWGMSSGNTGHWQLQIARSEKSFSDIMAPNKAIQRSHHFVNMRYGMSNDEWTAELYIDNVTDKRAEISNTFVFDRSRLSVIKPRTLGLRYKKSF
ncbi:TonB-dependent receptor [Gammaproteobacteria bacterium]|nr:TonB-dependent receptor [Gammaproteobacteria bacterium]MDA8683020.1 TonB-dependent receptor [Gammaproteobacteria bacterium]MDA8865382.1 TonB-dependent receptor [Gammaproteobacteria bacterium]MDA8908360.1 TonB-dependent receptor [Gammaproteobacteria bacterium]MDB4157225.1 TonB-dependent receptor [Gammaproteobacteria bacterium]